MTATCLPCLHCNERPALFQCLRCLDERCYECFAGHADTCELQPLLLENEGFETWSAIAPHPWVPDEAALEATERTMASMRALHEEPIQIFTCGLCRQRVPAREVEAHARRCATTISDCYRRRNSDSCTTLSAGSLPLR